MKKVINSNISELSQDLLEFDEEELQDKKVTVHIHEQDKIKVKNQFVLLFVENLHNLLVKEKISLSELKVLLSIVRFSSYQNVFKITQTTIAKDINMHRSHVSAIMKKLREKQLILEDSTGVEYVNPYLFLKGSIKELKATERFKQMSLHFNDETIKNPF